MPVEDVDQELQGPGLLALYQESGAPGLVSPAWSIETLMEQQGCVGSCSSEPFTKTDEQDGQTVPSHVETRQSRGLFSEHEKSNFPEMLFCVMAQG